MSGIKPEELIEELRKYPVLYDQTKEQYRNADYKDMIWKKVAKELNVKVMASNYGKFIDRSPLIYAVINKNAWKHDNPKVENLFFKAGKPTGEPNGPTVASTLKEYSLEDKITALKHNAKIWNEDVFVPPLKHPPFRNPAFKGLQTEIKDILTPPVQTRYQTLMQDLKETTYTSYWNKEVGKVRDQVPGLPAGTIPKEVTFGKPSVREISLKELINPSKTPDQVEKETEIGHELYKKTHNDYHSGEKIERGYNVPFDPTNKFGIKSTYDPRGIGMKCCVDWFIKEPCISGSKLQADHFHRIKPQVGKVLAPNNNIERVPVGHIFGNRTERACYGVEDLLKDPNVKPCFFKREVYEWIASLNKLRTLMRKRPNFSTDLGSFEKRALYYDKEKQGFMPLYIFHELCTCYKIIYHKQHLEELFRFLNIIVDDLINYRQFIDLLNTNAIPLNSKEFQGIPRESLYYSTTSQAAACDYLEINNSNMPAAGIPSIRTDLPRPVVPPGGVRADLENLGEYTSARTLLNPSIYTTYGLNFRDFFMPRSAETLKSLFEKVGHNFPGDSFNKIWKEGLEIDKTGSVCVDTFNILVMKYFPPPKLLVDELECSKMPL